MWAKSKQSGFTVVELLIIIVVVGVIAARVIVGYSNITNGARDSERKSEIASIVAALNRYFDDNGAYPRCNAAGANTSPYALSASEAHNASCLTDDLVPTYMPAIPTDPINTAGSSYQYHYAAGYKQLTATSYSGTAGPGGTPTNNYILGVKLEATTSPTYSGWGHGDLTYLVGSNK
jgi:general secretion pathway protein G